MKIELPKIESEIRLFEGFLQSKPEPNISIWLAFKESFSSFWVITGIGTIWATLTPLGFEVKLLTLIIAKISPISW